MLYRALRISFSFTTILYCATSETLTKNNEKRLEIANKFQMCLDSFDVHKDKIIRTEDSLKKGAKYLTEVDVDSREDCLKACCGTDRCDVFIFEEQKPGSCYLFQCGPLYNFKCKFMKHANYTSAVRTNYNTRVAGRLEEETHISQQEHELKSLRKLGNVAPLEYSFTEPTVEIIPTQTPKPVLTSPALIKQACSRNQYECRSSGDCIAIYNVCDGIPQCADGSDEAADLVCPTEKPTAPPPVILQKPPQPLPVEVTKYPQKTFPKPWEVTNLGHQAVAQQQNLLYPAQQLEIPQLQKAYGPPGYQWDYRRQYEKNKDFYDPANSYREQSNLNPYEQEQPRLFDRKGSQVDEGEPDSSGVYLEPKQPYVARYPPSNLGMLQEGQLQPQLPPATLTPPDVPRMEVKEKPAKSTTVPPCDTSAERVGDSNNDNEVEKTDPKAEGNKHAKDTGERVEKPTNVIKNEIVKHQSDVQPTNVKEHKSVIVIEDHPRERERGGLITEHLEEAIESEVLRPKGAVISLALGLIATAVTATLIACRLRVVRRRGRRGHGPYAHDADYLVNGMYL